MLQYVFVTYIEKYNLHYVAAILFLGLKSKMIRAKKLQKL